MLDPLPYPNLMALRGGTTLVFSSIRTSVVALRLPFFRPEKIAGVAGTKGDVAD